MKSKTIGTILLILAAITSIIMIIFGTVWEEGNEKRVNCYDQFSNKIDGLDCWTNEKGDLKDEFAPLGFLILFLTLFGTMMRLNFFK